MVVLLSLTAALLGGAPQQVVLVKGSAVGISDQTAATVLRTVGEALQERGFATQLHQGACDADRSCLAKASQSAGAAAALGVTMVRGRKDITIDLEAVDAQERQLAVQTFSANPRGRPFSGEAATFFDSLAGALAAPLESDVPRVVDLASHPSAGRSELAAAPPSRTRQLSSGAAAVGGVAALACLIGGLVVKGDLDSRLQAGPVVTGFTRDEAQGRAGLANGLFTGALLSAAVAGAAGVAAGVLWSQESAGAAE
ncbi:MAG: hypothetical protein ACYC8T_22365 [Myxococcaceae bacterium]